MKMKYTPENITSLDKNEVFVFGSNLAGNHVGGAARVAYKRFGAIMGQGIGLQGQAYAIPTMHGGVEAIKPYVDDFIAFAKSHSDMSFYVTRIGCGIAGFTDQQIAPLFDAAFDLENVILPETFAHIINHARQLASETACMVFHSTPIKFFEEDLKKSEGMDRQEKNDFFRKLRKEGRYIIVHESPESVGNILNTDSLGHHKIAISEDDFAIAAGKKLYSKDWSWGLDFSCDVLSVISIEKKKIDNLTKKYGNFAVLLSDGSIHYVWSEACIEPLLAENDFVSVESGCGGLIFGLRKNGTISVAFEENAPDIAAEVKRWNNIVSIASSLSHIIGLVEDGTVVLAGDKQYFEDVSGWRNIRKVYAYDMEPFSNSHNDQVFGIDKDGWLYISGSPWNNARQYWRKLMGQYDVVDIVSNHDATLLRYMDGSVKLITCHAMHNFEKDMEFIQKYNNFRFLAARGDTVVIIDNEGEFCIDVNKEERKWWE